MKTEVKTETAELREMRAGNFLPALCRVYYTIFYCTIKVAVVIVTGLGWATVVP